MLIIIFITEYVCHSIYPTKCGQLDSSLTVGNAFQQHDPQLSKTHPKVVSMENLFTLVITYLIYYRLVRLANSR